MANWLKTHWRWVALNLVAVAAMATLLRTTNRIGLPGPDDGPLVDAGRWAVRFLLVSLSITPLNTVFGWRSLIPLRKPAGLWAFAFGLLHFVVYIADMGDDWLRYPIPDYIAGLGVLALALLTPIAITSTRWAMRRLGKWWKRLHRLVYAAGILALVHGVLESIGNKRVAMIDPLMHNEMMLYLVLLAVLLAARIPPVRSWLAGLRHSRLRVKSA